MEIHYLLGRATWLSNEDTRRGSTPRTTCRVQFTNGALPGKATGTAYQERFPILPKDSHLQQVRTNRTHCREGLQGMHNENKPCGLGQDASSRKEPARLDCWGSKRLNRHAVKESDPGCSSPGEQLSNSGLR
jgi:hypothetical protein